ncbi:MULTISPECIES: hypothetical protein [Clostridium]|uniref:Plasmodium variant antigen protein Cir/Yir/Bir n=1 Tax=Clostridium cibarium TaxID=2762247 RepID=A0ABR8PSK6_9CLOT|nr:MULTISPECIES: hypothetical protein [Clostridium]MBD7911159.1 hypothetical protein [Clostridium cibarium]
MNNINTYNNMASLNIKNKSVTNATNLTTKNQTNKTDNKSSNTSDTIEIEQKNKTIINTKKAYDALQETCKEFGTVECGGDICGTMQFYVNTIMDLMKTNGMSVPDFNLSGENINNNDFSGFIDKLKEFTKKAMEDKNSINIAPDNFFNFCDVWKEKLIQNGCN